MSNDPLIIDGHLDLSMNAMQWNRDLRLPVAAIRQREEGMKDKPDRRNNTVALPAMRKGSINICIATLIARYAKPTHPLGGWRSPEQAWSTVQGQLAWYREMERLGEMSQIQSSHDLKAQLQDKTDESPKAIAYLLSLEGADSIVTFDHLYRLHEDGLRAIGPAHYGPGTYAYGTDSDGSIGSKGRELLSKMDELGIALDATHLSDTSFWEALDHFKGTVWASHSNCRSLVNHNRQFSDDQLKALIERDAVIGAPLDAWMMVTGWERGVNHPNNTEVKLDMMIDHMDHICQLAGNAKHIAIGTDLDGGFGKEQCPSDIETISDLQKLSGLLSRRAYSSDQVSLILHGNWLRKFQQLLA